MSAFIVDLEHINVMVWAGSQLEGHYGPMRWTTDIEDGDMPAADSEPDNSGFGRPYNVFYLRPDTRNRVGQMLLDANVASVDYRYNETNDVEVYRYQRPLDTEWSVGELLNAIHGYEYQACETPDWQQSEAHAFCRALEQKLIRQVPGYESGPWEITDRKQSLATKKQERVNA